MEKAKYIPLRRQQVGVRSDRTATEIFTRRLHFIEGSSVPQEKRETTRDSRQELRANAGALHLTLINRLVLEETTNHWKTLKAWTLLNGYQ